LREGLRAVMQGFAARTGATIRPVEADQPTLADWRAEQLEKERDR